MNVTSLQCVYDPGCHCAFTDIFRWHGRGYLAFREALNHSIHPSGQIVVLCSADLGASFQAHGRLAKGGVDLRDPHFFAVEDRLCLALPSWLLPDGDRGSDWKHATRTTFVAQSADGIHWDLREIEALRGRSLWRPRRGPDGLWYAAGYASSRAEADYRVALFRTRDGWEWEEVSLIHGAEQANETDLCFLPDGELLALVRRESPPRRPLLARSRPPYREWEKVECNRFLQGPLLVRLPAGGFVVVGRSVEPLDAKEPTGECRTRIFRLDARTGDLDPLLTLPSGGDTSYAGFCPLDETTGLLSYYSGHLYAHGSYRAGDAPQRCGIYVARLALG